MESIKSCNFLSWLMWSSIVAAQYQNVLLIYDRYLGVTQTEQYQRQLMNNLRRPVLLTAVVVVASLGLLTPFILPYKWASESKCSQSSLQNRYTPQTDSYGILVVYVVILSFGIPFATVVPLNIIIVTRIR